MSANRRPWIVSRQRKVTPTSFDGDVLPALAATATPGHVCTDHSVGHRCLDPIDTRRFGQPGAREPPPSMTGRALLP